jgi:type II secretory pathway pseudopilin PulG
MLGGEAVGPSALVDLITGYTQAINEGKCPALLPLWQQQSSNACQEAVESALAVYREIMEAALAGLPGAPLESDVLNAKHNEATDAAVACYRQAAYGPAQVEVSKILITKLDDNSAGGAEGGVPRGGEFLRYYQINLDASTGLCKRVAQDVYEQVARRVEGTTAAKYGSMAEFTTDKDSAKNEYDTKARGPAVLSVWKEAKERLDGLQMTVAGQLDLSAEEKRRLEAEATAKTEQVKAQQAENKAHEFQQQVRRAQQQVTKVQHEMEKERERVTLEQQAMTKRFDEKMEKREKAFEADMKKVRNELEQTKRRAAEAAARTREIHHHHSSGGGCTIM